MVQWKKVWGLEFFRTSKDGLTTKKYFPPSQGHMVILGAKTVLFRMLVGSRLFWPESGLPRWWKMTKYVRITFVPIPMALFGRSGSYLAGYYRPVSKCSQGETKGKYTSPQSASAPAGTNAGYVQDVLEKSILSPRSTWERGIHLERSPHHSGPLGTHLCFGQSWRLHHVGTWVGSYTLKPHSMFCDLKKHV